ncbi:hypothetical protein BO71DRAFT_38793 [Aspergillus ellipticus CBS 707.79]|uniref:Uncharacterized protein n=1 Tax=Aspergillus ellipticus CBS 707.79 TaxID=1448320 RepID=A0A319D2N8_9EURO|nr:hypothetical protein BO71DRAFT_38793 [Aspergillus ellipticus CBS 707.79]
MVIFTPVFGVVRCCEESSLVPWPPCHMQGAGERDEGVLDGWMDGWMDGPSDKAWVGLCSMGAGWTDGFRRGSGMDGCYLLSYCLLPIACCCMLYGVDTYLPTVVGR